MKTKNISSFDLIDGTPTFKPFVKNILDIAANRIYKIYELEFFDFSKDNSKNINTILYDSNEIDAHASISTVSFSSGSNTFLKHLFKQKQYLTFSFNKHNQIRYDLNGTHASALKDGNEKYIIDDFITENDFIENDLSLKDYFIYLYLKDSIDLNFFLDVLPHEISHCFGFEGGIYEGATETFNREVCHKYNITSFPFSHPEETKLFQKVEKVLGRDVIVETLLSSTSTNHDISKLIDNKTSNPKTDNNWFERYMFLEKKYFKICKKDKNSPELTDIKKSIDNIMNKLNSQLDYYIQNNPDKLFTLGETSPSLDIEHNRKKLINSILEMQQDEINTLENILYNLEYLPNNNATTEPLSNIQQQHTIS